MEALTGARLDWRRSGELGPERAGAVHFAKSIVVVADGKETAQSDGKERRTALKIPGNWGRNRGRIGLEIGAQGRGSGGARVLR